MNGIIKILLIALLFCVGSFANSTEPMPQKSLEVRIKGILESQDSNTSRVWLAKKELLKFYKKRDYAPAWIGSSGILPQANELIFEIYKLPQEGLDPAFYHIGDIEANLAFLTRNLEFIHILFEEQLAELDLLLSDAYLALASHLHYGSVGQEIVFGRIEGREKSVDLTQRLENALLGGTIAQSLEALRPAHPAYRALMRALAEYRQIEKQGGWPYILCRKNLVPGDQNEWILELRKRLAAEGYKSVLTMEQNTTLDFFDVGLKRAVMEFQSHHGLDPDGVVGPNTIQALNISVKERVAQIKANLERWRWLPRELEDRYIMVNIPGFSLDVVENGKSVLDMKAIVGRIDRPTPLLDRSITYLVFNPYWKIPKTIIKEDLLPKIINDTDYLKRNHIRVFADWQMENEINPSDINWKKIDKERLYFVFRQDPGPSNPLGKVKFMFPNEYDVYIHDTPEEHLFERDIRSYSSGCIRIERAMDLVDYFLKNDPKVGTENISAILEAKKEKIIRLSRPIRLYLVYFTAIADEEGVVQFRPDIYGYDRKMEEFFGDKVWVK